MVGVSAPIGMSGKGNNGKQPARSNLLNNCNNFG